MRILFFISLFLIPFRIIAQESPLLQKIDLSLEEHSLEETLLAIKKKTGIEFSYSSNYFPKEKFTVNFKNQSLEDVLKSLLDKNNLQFKLIGNQIVISRKSGKGKITISGYIRDQESGEALIGATVYDYLSHQGTVTNHYGYYSITIPDDSVFLVASYVGYERSAGTIYGEPTASLDFKLKPSVLLNMVEVTDSRTSPEESQSINGITIPLQQAKSIPVILGEADIIKILPMIPGVSSGVEGSSNLVVRGGNFDQNLILLDGVPVYNPSHLLGFVSIFNPDAINHMELYKGGFPSRYNGRLSSVVDISTKEGNLYRYKGGGTIGFLSSRLYFEGPVVKDKGSFIVSGRRTYFDRLAKGIITLAGENPFNQFHFFLYDLNFKANYRITKKDRVYISSYFGRDKFLAEDETINVREGIMEKNGIGINWGNRIHSLRWNREITPKLFGNLTLSHSTYDMMFDLNFMHQDIYGTESSSYKYKSGIQDQGAKIDLDFYPNSKHHIKTGTSFNFFHFNPGTVLVSLFGEPIPEGGIYHNPVIANQLLAFAEDNFKASDKLFLNYGVNFSLYNVRGKAFPSLHPRVSARYALQKNTSVTASFASMTQVMHFTNSTTFLNLPVDLWMPATEMFEPQNSIQYTAGVEQKLPRELSIQAEAYYKSLSNLIEYKEGSSALYLDDWENHVTVGRGWGYGSEFFLQKRSGKTTAWVGYGLSWAYRQFDELNLGRPFYFNFDRRHDFKTALSRNISKNFEVSANWIFATGSPITLPEARYQDIYGERLYFSRINNYRLRNIHRLDLAVTYRKETKWGESIWNLSVYNAYNRANPVFVTYFKTDQGYSFQQFSFPILPSLSYSFRF